ncbi:MAG: hypothetical protein WBF90_19545 [Rivularia sp. (in: cyanobacteria)]|jgi:hypothetical protein
MSKKKDNKLPIKIKTLSKNSLEEHINASIPDTSENSTEDDLSQNCEAEITQKNSKVRKTIITAEIPATSPKIVGQIPPWDDDNDSEQDDKSKPPTITAEIPSESEKFDLTPRATGEIPPWDDEEES